MKLFKLLTGKREIKKNVNKDIYQESLEQFGREQLLRLAKKGLSIKVMVL